MMSEGGIIGALPMPVIVLDRRGRVSSSNDAARALLGVALAGRHHVSILRQPLLLDAVEEAIAGRGATAPFVTQEGRRDVAWTVTARPVDGGGALLLFEDRSLRDTVGQMQRDFVANVSHELKTPITAILGYIETLSGPAREDAAARDRFLSSMGREAKRMSRLVSDLLTLSRVESQGRSRPRETVDVISAVESVRHTLRERHGPESDRITLKAPDHADVIGDQVQIEQLIENLLENALRYSHGAPIVVTVTRPSDEPSIRGPGIRLSIRDEGPGIAPHHIPRLTDRFYRVDEHRSREIGGTGLGLSIVDYIVSRHRGRLTIESELGVGSTFTVILPAQVSEESALS